MALRRTPFKSKLPPPRQAKVYTGANPGTPAVAFARVAAVEREVVPLPKGPKAKPGKRAPTAAERRWLDAIVAYGCVACRHDGLGIVAPAVHHMLRGGVRLGHLFSLPLCDPGHHQGGAALGMVSRHPWKVRFERRYGSEDFLLRNLQRELGFA